MPRQRSMGRICSLEGRLRSAWHNTRHWLVSGKYLLWKFSQSSVYGVCLRLCKHYFLPPDGKNLHGFKHTKKLKDELEGGRHLIRSRCVSMVSSKVSFLLPAYDYSYPKPPQKDSCLLSCREELQMQFPVLFIWPLRTRRKEEAAFRAVPSEMIHAAFGYLDRPFKPLAAFCLCKQELQLRWKEAMWLIFWHLYI